MVVFETPPPAAPTAEMKRTCDLQQRADMGTCNRIGRDDPSVDVRQCEAAKAARYNACLQSFVDGSEIPPLLAPSNR